MPPKPTLTSGPVHIVLAKLVAPMFVGVLAMIAFNTIDTWFVAQLGTGQLAAMALTFPLVFTVMSIALGVGIATSILVAKAIGQSDNALVKRLTTDALSASVILTVVLTVAGLLTLTPVLHLVGADSATLGYARSYMVTWTTGMLFLFVPTVANMAIRATGDTVTPSILMILSVVLNTILDPLFIYGWGPVPRMGITGAALATVIARAVACLYSVYLLAFRERILTNPVSDIRATLSSWAALARVGVPIAINNFVTPFMAGAVTRLSANVGGVAGVAAFGIATRLESIALTPMMALQSVIGPFTGQNWGAGLRERAREGFKRSQQFSLVWGIALGAALIVLSRPLAMLFDKSPQVVDYTVLYFYVVGISLGFKGLYLVSSAGLNSLEHSVDATIWTLIQGVVLAIPLAWAGSIVFGVAGVFGGVAVSNFVVGVLIVWWLRRVAGR